MGRLERKLKKFSVHIAALILIAQSYALASVNLCEASFWVGKKEPPDYTKPNYRSPLLEAYISGRFEEYKNELEERERLEEEALAALEAQEQARKELATLSDPLYKDVFLSTKRPQNAKTFESILKALSKTREKKPGSASESLLFFTST